MRIYQKTEALAKKFDTAYPRKLSARLEWWSGALGIDRVRLLRMIGLSARQAGERKDEDLKAILKNPDWEMNAQMVEGGLLRLLSLFHYDWHALAERIHTPVVAREQRKPSGATRRKGTAERLRSTANGAASELLVNRLAEGGPQLLPTLMAYLAASASRRADS